MKQSAVSMFRSCIAVAAVLLAAGFATSAHAKDNRAPVVPPEIVMPDGYQVHFHGFAEGVQIYTWTGTNWSASVPEAILYDNDGNVVAVHYMGPSWESTSGSKVVGSLVPPPLRVTVDPTAIPWLLLTVASAEGPGIFAETKYIHRVNTVGGKAPSVAGTFVGEVVRVPYTADYFFYRKSNL